MPRTRRRFDASFKAQVALEALRGLKTVHEIARQFQIHPSQVTRWKKQLHSSAEQVFESGSDKASRSHELSAAVLHEQIDRLKTDLAWLQRKIAEHS